MKISSSLRIETNREKNISKIIAIFTQPRTFFKLKLDMVIIRVNIYFDFSVSVICLKTIYDDNVDFYFVLTRTFFFFSSSRHIPKWLKNFTNDLIGRAYSIDELTHGWKQKRQLWAEKLINCSMIFEGS